MGFRTGGDKGAEAAKKQQGARSLVRYLPSEVDLKDEGDRAFVRLLTEQTDWIYVDMHQFVPTKSEPADYKGKWPEKMSAVCQNDEAFKDEATGEYLPGYGNCYICNAPQYKAKDRFGKPMSKTILRGWALMCIREPREEGGRITGFQDAIVEVKLGDDKTEKVRNIVVAIMGHKNFYANLNSLYGLHGTVRDRDYLIQVVGEGTDKNYQFIGMDPIPDHRPESESWGLYEQACEKQGLDLEKIVSEQASPEYYAKFFVPGEGESAASAEPEAQSNGPAQPSPEAMNELLGRIKGHGGQQPKVA